MPNSKVSFRSIPISSNIVAKNIELLLFISVTLMLLVSLLNEDGTLDKGIKGTLFVSAVIFDLYFFYSLFKEPAFLSISNNEVILRPSFYFIKRRVPISAVEGFSLKKRPFYLNKRRMRVDYNAYQLHLKNGKKVMLTEYYFLNFNQFSSALRKSGLEFLGKENNV